MGKGGKWGQKEENSASGDGWVMRVPVMFRGVVRVQPVWPCGPAS